MFKPVRQNARAGFQCANFVAACREYRSAYRRMLTYKALKRRHAAWGTNLQARLALDRKCEHIAISYSVWDMTMMTWNHTTHRNHVASVHSPYPDVDLDAAFNDGYELSPRPLIEVILQWFVMIWAVAALLEGSTVMARTAIRLFFTGLKVLQRYIV
jgi:hypothetical protein